MKGSPTLAAEPFILCRRRPLWAIDSKLRRTVEERASWRWIPYEAAAQRIEQWRNAVRDRLPGERAVVLGSPSTEALIADLAVRSLGLVAVHPRPAEGDERSAEGLGSLIDEVSLLIDALPDGGAPDRMVEETSFERRRVPDELPRGQISAEQSGLGSPTAAGGCRVRMAGGADRELSGDELEVLVDRLDRVLGGGRTRRTVVHGRPLSDLTERVLVEWAIRAAAALIIADEPGAVGTAAFELRPSILHGTSRDLAGWAAAFERAEGGMRGVERRFRRHLEWVVVTGREPLDTSVASLFAGLGAAVVSLEESSLLDLDRL